MARTTASVMLLIALAGIVFSAPALRGMAVNEKNQQCAGYWGGDENTQYELPEGWVAYYSDAGKMTVGERSCYSDAKSCCEELGYAYVSENIGANRDLTQQSPLPALAGVLLVLLAGSAAFLVFARKGKNSQKHD
jgi:hypothetical protein